MLKCSFATNICSNELDTKMPKALYVCIMYMYKKYFYCGPPHAAYTCGCEKVYGVAVCFFSL